MTPVLLDTHTLIWLIAFPEKLGRRSRALLDRAQTQAGLNVSAISFWEIAMLADKGAIELNVAPARWRADALSRGLQEVALDGDIAIRATEIMGFHGDPADRMIAATALQLGATLVTADETLLSWRSRLKRQDASR